MNKEKSLSSANHLKEPESLRLGRDTEKLIETMEKEKREAVYLDQQISLLKEELAQISSSKKLIFPASNNEDQLKNRCLILEKRIELEVIHLNQTKAQSQLLRNEVNNNRKDKKHFKRALQNLKNDIQEVSKSTQEKQLDYSNSLERQNRYKKQIQSLRSRSQLEKNDFSEKVRDYSLFIQEKIDVRKVIHNQIKEGILGQIKRQTDSVDIIKLQKSIYERWDSKIKEKKKSMDNYLRHLNILKETFSQIKTATGIQSVNEIVTAVIKSEEQNNEVYSYVNVLNSEIDKVQESYKNTLKQIEKLREDPKFELMDSQNRGAEIDHKKNKEIGKYKRAFEQVQKTFPGLKNIFSCCLQSGLPVQNKGEDFLQLDDIEYDQIFEFLGYIEEYLKLGSVFLKSIEGDFGEKVEAGRSTLKDLEIKDFFNDDFEESRNPMSLLEFQQKTQNFLKTNPMFSK